MVAKVIKPAKWVPNVLAIEKQNEKKDLRICLDPKELNKAIKISPKYQIPKADEELLSQLSGKKIFTVLGVSSGF